MLSPVGPPAFLHAAAALFLLLVQNYRCFDGNAAQQVALRTAACFELDAFTAPANSYRSGFRRFSVWRPSRVDLISPLYCHSEVDRDYNTGVAFTLEIGCCWPEHADHLPVHARPLHRPQVWMRFARAPLLQDFNGQRFAARCDHDRGRCCADLIGVPRPGRCGQVCCTAKPGACT